MLSLFGVSLADFVFLVLHISGAGSFPKPLSQQEEEECLKLMWEQKDKNARKKLIERNLRLVAHIIKKYYAGYKEQDDLISIGTIGLIKGIDSFSMGKGTKLATYASRCIENEILMYFRNRKKLMSEVFLNEPIDTDGNGNTIAIIDTIKSEDNILEDIDKNIKIEKLSVLLSKCLCERERKIISLRYGLGNEKPLTQRETAEILGISRSYVSRIEKKALDDLKRSLS